MPGRGALCQYQDRNSSSSKLNLNLSVRLSERCLCTEPTSVRNLFQNGYSSTLIDMLKYSLRLPEFCVQFKYLEFHSKKQIFNVGRAYYCHLILEYFSLVILHANRTSPCTLCRPFHARIQRWDRVSAPPPPPLKNHKI